MRLIDFNKKKGFICDMDGVIYRGSQVLPGVSEFIDWLNREYDRITIIRIRPCESGRTKKNCRTILKCDSFFTYFVF